MVCGVVAMLCRFVATSFRAHVNSNCDLPVCFHSRSLLLCVCIVWLWLVVVGWGGSLALPGDAAAKSFSSKPESTPAQETPLTGIQFLSGIMVSSVPAQACSVQLTHTADQGDAAARGKAMGATLLDVEVFDAEALGLFSHVTCCIPLSSTRLALGDSEGFLSLCNLESRTAQSPAAQDRSGLGRRSTDAATWSVSICGSLLTRCGAVTGISTLGAPTWNRFKVLASNSLQATDCKPKKPLQTYSSQ